MIDTHCHIDQYQNPHQIISECESQNIITIGVTNLPSHFQIGFPYVEFCKKIRLALGMHPLYAHIHEKEFPLFLNNIDRTSYIGEIGLDFSKVGISTKEIQIKTFNKILKSIEGKKKILSIHSRRAEKYVLALLIKYKITNAIFHWYSGPLYLIDKITEAGYYFSINPAMIESENGKKIISKIPLDRILTESDGPYISVNNRQIKPNDVILVIEYLAKLHLKTIHDIENIICINFKRILLQLK